MKVARKPNWSMIESQKTSGVNPGPSAFTLTELMVVIAVVTLFAAMLLHSQASTKADALHINCARNLKQVGLAFHLWAANHNDQFPMAVDLNNGGAKPVGGQMVESLKTYTVFLVMSNELITPKVVVCPADIDMRPPKKSFIPAGGTFPGNAAAAVFTNNTATSYFVGRDSSFLKPRMLLSGDRNIYGPITANTNYGNSGGPYYYYSGSLVSMGTNSTELEGVGWTDKLHAQQGNVTMSDGSVQQFNSYYLRQALRDSGDTTSSPGANTILFP
jgi:prepilin-type N-terminal cleavage/methylation domain-containing protein